MEQCDKPTFPSLSEIRQMWREEKDTLAYERFYGLEHVSKFHLLLCYVWWLFAFLGCCLGGHEWTSEDVDAENGGETLICQVCGAVHHIYWN